MREGAVQYLGDSIVCGSVWPVGELQRVHGGHAGEAVLGTGTIVDHLKQAGTMDLVRERLTIVVNTGASWFAQIFGTRPPNRPSGPAAFPVFTLIRALLTSCLVTERVCSSLSIISAMVPLALLLLASNRA